MPRLSIVAILVTTMLGLAVRPSSATEQKPTQNITWEVPVIPPGYMKKGDDIEGYATDILRWFFARLPEFSHKIAITPIARSFEHIQNGLPVCNPGLIPTPARRKFIHFSNPIFLNLPISVIVRADEQKVFNAYKNGQGQIDLPRLLANTSLHTAVEIGRSYGPKIDAALSARGQSQHIMRAARSGQFIQMMGLDRLQWILAYPDEAEYILRQKNLNFDIVSIPIAGANDAIRVSVGCAKTETGRNVVTAINRVLRKNPTMPWMKYYAQSLPSDAKKRLKNQLDHYIATRTTNTSPAPQIADGKFSTVQD